MFFLKKPIVRHIVLKNIIVKLTCKGLFLFSQKTGKFLILKDFNKDNFFIQDYLCILNIQPLFQLKKKNFQLCGLLKKKIKQNIKNVSNSIFKKTLFLKGVGFKAKVDGKSLILKLGFSHDIYLKIPAEVRVLVFKPTKFVCSGPDIDKLSQFITNIRLLKKPDVYKGKGVLFKDEKVLQKEGKKTK